MEFPEEPKHQQNRISSSSSLMYKYSANYSPSPFDSPNDQSTNNISIYKIIEEPYRNDPYQYNSYQHDYNTKERYRERAEGYLTWRGATKNPVTGYWDFDGDIKCDPETFLVYDGKLTVNFGEITGYFACCGVGLESLEGLPTKCHELHISDNNIKGEIFYLPEAQAYDLSHNQITSIDAEFYSGANYIDISNNELMFLPDMKNLYLSDFDCSYNKLTTLTNAPMAYRFIASFNEITEFTEDREILFNIIGNYLDVSFNDLRSLKGVPPVKQLDCHSNYNLFSAIGMDKTYEIHGNKGEGIEDIFIDITLSDTGLLTLDYLPRAAYRINVTNTKITNLKSNSLEIAYMLIAKSCEDLKEGANPNLRSNTLYLNTSSKFKGFKTFAKIANTISYDMPKIPASISHEIDFFNKTNEKSKAKNPFRKGYHLMFLEYLYEHNKISKETPEKTVSSYHWPKSFEEKIYNSAKSLDSAAKFNL